MEVRRATKEGVAGLRAARKKEMDLAVIPGFYVGLAAEAEPFVLTEAEQVVGYTLLLGREHEGHVHTTLIELGLTAGHADRWEDALDAIRDAAQPTAYLARTDDCRLNATLSARGLQVEATALVLLTQDSRGGAAAVAAGPPLAGLEFTPLHKRHVAAIAEVLEAQEAEEHRAAGGHHHGPTAAETLEQVQAMASAEEGWVLFRDGIPQAVIARLEPEEGDHELLDFVLAQGEETGLAWAFARATEEVKAGGRRPAAVIDALDPVRHRILRAAGYYTAAAYMVFYDPLAGRPSVPTVTLEELRGMIAGKERFHLVDVLGEEHWKAGHLPGSEWIDFRGLGRQARKRYKKNETIVVYCNGFT